MQISTFVACLVLGLATCAQASSRPQDRDKDKDKDTPAKHAQKAAKVKIIHAPVVESAKDTTATIAWSTNVKASTILKYGTDPKDLNHTAEAPWGGPTHRVYLRGLKPGTTYYFRVESTQAAGTGSQVLSGVDQFRTQGGTPAQAANRPSSKPAAVKLTHGPVVESVKPTTATIAWSTNDNSSTILKYGTNPQALNQLAEAPWGGLTHRVYLRHLKPGTTYYYRVESTQAQGTGTQAVSGVEQFKTEGTAAAAATPAPAAKTASADPALNNFHQFLVTHPNIKTDLQKNPELARNGRYMVTHPGFSQFLQTHPVVRQRLAQNPKSFVQSEEMIR
jgi:hypothetical protein